MRLSLSNEGERMARPLSTRGAVCMHATESLERRRADGATVEHTRSASNKNWTRASRMYSTSPPVLETQRSAAAYTKKTNKIQEPNN